MRERILGGRSFFRTWGLAPSNSASRLLAIAIHKDAIQDCSHPGQVYGQSWRGRFFGREGLLAALGFRRRALGLGLAV